MNKTYQINNAAEIGRFQQLVTEGLVARGRLKKAQKEGLVVLAYQEVDV